MLPMGLSLTAASRRVVHFSFGSGVLILLHRIIGLRACLCSSWWQNRHSIASIICEYAVPHPPAFANHTPDIHRMCVWKHTEGYTRTMKHVHHSGLTEQYDVYWIRIFPLVEHTDLCSWCDKARFMLLDMPSWLTQKSPNFWSVSSVKPSITFHNDSLATATQRAPMPTLQHLVRWNRFGSELPLIDNAHTNSHWQGYTFVIILRLC